MSQTTSRHHATSALTALIAERRYRVGDRLPPERELSETLGVSRPTIREAIGRLVADGVLVSRRGSGTYVAPVDLDHIFTVRLALEPLVASLAAQHRSASDVVDMRTTLKEMNAAVDDADRFSDADAHMHELLAAASRNPVLCDVLDRLTGLAKLSRSVTSGDAAVRAQTLRQMTVLVSVVARGDSAAADQAMREHLVTVQRSLGM